MRADTVIKNEGFNALFDKMDLVEVERFMVLIKRENFDYTNWRKNLWENYSVEELSNTAMNYCNSQSQN